jgi:carbamoyl-phosphate synthase large subunit
MWLARAPSPYSECREETDLKRVLIIGSGPIVIGQACEFDYSGSQACKALRAEGWKSFRQQQSGDDHDRPELADRTYVEPLTPEVAGADHRARAYRRAAPDGWRPDGAQPRRGPGECRHSRKFKVEMIGASIKAIKIAEGPSVVQGRDAEIGLDVRRAASRGTAGEALELAKTLGFPLVIRPSFTLGRHRGGIAYNIEEFRDLSERGLELSPVHEVLIEESVIGWKEFELEVMRDVADNFVVICSIENIDPMGVHTGDSITVAPR